MILRIAVRILVTPIVGFLYLALQALNWLVGDRVTFYELTEDAKNWFTGRKVL